MPKNDENVGTAVGFATRGIGRPGAAAIGGTESDREGPRGTEMDDLAEAYRAGVQPHLEELRSTMPLVRDGDTAAIERVNGISHQLKGSGTSFGYPEITSLATAVLHASPTDFTEATEALVAGLDGVLGAEASTERITIVDDDPLIRMILAKTLTSPGREFRSAASLAEARLEIDATTVLVLLDLFLPDGDGQELLAELQTDPETAGIPVIVLSGSDSEEVRRDAMNAGAAAFLEKPFESKTLTDLVDGLLPPGGAVAAAAVGGVAGDPSSNESPAALTVVLAEDDDLVAALISDRLSRDGYEIRHHADGESALADALQAPPDLVILDVMMPKMNGFEVLGRLRDANQTADIPVIMLTGRGREEDVVHAFDLGATDYIVKPFSPAELAVRVRRHTTAS
ncbi:MAG: response regulator [Actinomycetia bacterium]|nr:response regulator [Actinomycetes bacterium]